MKGEKVRILMGGGEQVYLVAQPGVEPGTRGHEPRVIPFHYRAICGTPAGVRTQVAGFRVRSPRPLDERGTLDKELIQFLV